MSKRTYVNVGQHCVCDRTAKLVGEKRADVNQLQKRWQGMYVLVCTLNSSLPPSIFLAVTQFGSTTGDSQ